LIFLIAAILATKLLWNVSFSITNNKILQT
jgi:hypothetical protein